MKSGRTHLPRTSDHALAPKALANLASVLSWRAVHPYLLDFISPIGIEQKTHQNTAFSGRYREWH
jgi:hypothetical protein